MNLKKSINWAVAALGLVIIVIYLFKVESAFSETKSAEDVRLAVRNFHVSIWIGWVILTSAATYQQWTKKKYLLFILDYLVVIIAFIFLRSYIAEGESQDLWELGDSFKTGANYLMMRNVLLICFMTGFVQGAIWLFSSKWHRK